MFIQVDNVHLKYRSHGKTIEALNGLSLCLEKGEFVSVIGSNGCGKSSFAKMLNALVVPTEGTVLVEGMDTADEAKTMEIRRTVGLLFQNPDNQIVGDTVEEDVAFGPENLGLPYSEIETRLSEALAIVGLSDCRFRKPSELSGGQKQRLAIASVLALGCSCIVLDEATSMLDPEGRSELMSQLHRLNREKGLTVVQITHYMDECLDSDRVLVFDKGRLFMEGSPKQVFSHSTELASIGIGLPAVTQLALKAGLGEGIVSLEELVLALKERRRGGFSC